MADESTAAKYPTEFLNSRTMSGVPPHELRLKVNCPIMLLRNVDPTNGLCNGTRLRCIRFHPHLIQAVITMGTHAGKEVYLPRILFMPTDTEYPFVLRRRQFPVRPCFAMTINKAQGQTLGFVGVYLPRHVFAHGQLYVAMSRVSSPDSLRVCIAVEDLNNTDQYATRNIVHQELL